MELNDYIESWSEKLSISEQDIEKEYQGLLAEEKQIHPQLKEEEHKINALQRLAMSYKKQLRSPAVGFEGMIIAVGDVVDTVQRQKQEARTLYKENPQKAITNSVTDEDGTPLDTRKEWSEGRPNRNYGKPLPEHNYLRTAFGVALKKNIENSVKFFILNLSGEVANTEVPIFQPVQFRAIDRTPPELGEEEYRLNSSTFTNFIIDESLNLPPLKQLLDTYCGNSKVTIDNLDAYHIANEKDYSRLAIVEGDVTTLILEPTSVGSRRMIIDDEKGMFDMDSPGVTCWVPERINIDFAEQSKVIVLGRTSQGKKLDEQGNQTDEPGDVMLNVYGLYAIPEYKISPHVKELTMETATTEDIAEVEKQAEDEITSDW